MSNWQHITTLNELEQANNLSHSKPILIFKHSTRCSISSAALGRMQRGWDLHLAPMYYLDLIQFRNISNAVSQLYNVEHQSPQVMVIKDGKCIHHASHFDITPEEFSTLV
jgi:bacillithiol system protein YtxJ